MKQRKCPICKKSYKNHPALSRKDNKTEICPECGQREAFDIFYEDFRKRHSFTN